MGNIDDQHKNPNMNNKDHLAINWVKTNQPKEISGC